MLAMPNLMTASITFAESTVAALAAFFRAIEQLLALLRLRRTTGDSLN